MIKFENVSLSYDGLTDVITDLNLEINDNELLVIVGPSGCGKSSLVGMLSGLIKPTSGSIYFDDKKINDVEPYNRGISFMQQKAQPYPIFNVFDNIAFGLKVKKMDKELIKTKVEEIAEMLSIKPYLNRMPNELSGGERQRLNLARALVLDNKIVILDEPLSSIDVKLKQDMRLDIKKLHKFKNNTMIYITHDHEEAMSLADRIVLMNKGKIIQIGSPKELYDNPKDMFVADFIGKMNFIESDSEIIGFREEDVSLDGDLLVDIIDSELLGSKKKVFAKLDSQQIRFIVDNNVELKSQEKIKINKKYIFDKETKFRKD
ncbi:MAG: ABC transporter ATP-binding protein [Acholeplasmatales bacterium]|nr:ABC transporter ATP-binding protein [Acholeplasmatales bacterium]